MHGTSPALRGVHRRLAFPPPPARPSLAVWPEIGELDDELAGALFFLSRRARDLADSPPMGLSRWTRAADVRAAAACIPEIATDLLALGAPELSLTPATRGRLAGACHRLSLWAGECGYGELAVQFAETAVALHPVDAHTTYEAARTHRLFGHLDDAEVLYARAVCLARPGRHWWVYVRGHLGLGHICKRRGLLDRAAAHYRTAARRARDRSGEKWLASLIEHDLFALAAERGEVEIALHHALRAHAWMPAHNERVPLLVHDYAYLLLKAHAPVLARDLLERLVQKRLAAGDMVLVWSTFARVSAMLGDSERFRQAEREVEVLAPRFDSYAAAAYANLGMGGHALGLPEEAERHAACSAEIARTRGERQVLADAEALLAALRAGEPAPPTRTMLPPEPMQRLAASLAERLAGWRGRTWKRKRQSGRSRLGVV